MPEHDAEKCEAVFRAAMMLQVIGIDHGNDLDEVHPGDYRDRCGGLITWAHRSAAKKWPFPPPWAHLRPTGHIQRKMVRIRHGRRHFPATPTRASDRTGHCRPWSGA